MSVVPGLQGWGTIGEEKRCRALNVLPTWKIVRHLGDDSPIPNNENSAVNSNDYSPSFQKYHPVMIPSIHSQKVIGWPYRIQYTHETPFIQISLQSILNLIQIHFQSHSNPF